jgi:putative ABC transport system permease protein
VSAALGRTLGARDDEPAAEPAVVLSDALWRRRFNGSVKIIGERMLVNGRSAVIVGVMPRHFRFPVGWLSSDVELWMPLRLTPEESANRRATTLDVVARMKNAVSRETAEAELDVIARRLETEFPATNADWSVNVFPIRERVSSGLGSVLGFLALAVGAILAIACANVANLLLARGLDRQAELTVRTAIGAGRTRLVRQLVSEGLVLSALGGLGGIAFTVWAVSALSALAPQGALRDLGSMRVNGMVLVFAVALSALVGVVFSLLPALTQSRVSLAGALHDGARAGDGRGRSRLRSGVAVAELAIASALLVCASAALQSFRHHMTLDPGFDAANAVTMRIALPNERYPTASSRVELFEQLEAAVRTVPGVTAVAVGSNAPMDGGGAVYRYRVPGRPAPDPSERRLFTQYLSVGRDYFTAAGIAVLRGRTFSDADREGAPRVVIINEAFVQREFGDLDPMGAQIVLEGDVNRSAAAQAPFPPIEIVGVVADTKHYGLQNVTPPMLYVPMRQDPQASIALVVRTDGEPTAVVPGIRARLRRLDSQQPVYGIRTLEQVVRDSHSLFTLSTVLLAAFGASALMLSLVGVYGVFSTSVARRRREFGLRLALGAAPGDLAGLVLRRSLALSAVGLGAGLVVSWPALRALAEAMRSSMNVDLAADWSGAAVIVSVSMLVATSVAGLMPATRASKTDPLVVWRES